MTRSSERGSASVELVLIAPVLVGLMLFVVGLGRLAGAQGEVEAAARDASRAASNARSTSQATAQGTAAATATLDASGVRCTSLDVVVDTSRFRADGVVAAAVRCAVDLDDLSGIGFPGSRSVSGSAVAVVDRYRGTEP